MKRVVATALVCGSAMVLAGCGSSDSGPEGGSARPSPTEVNADPTTLPTACTLLPKVDVEEAFGEPVVAGPQSADECWWSSANDLKVVNLIRRTDDVATWRSGYQNDFWTPNDFGDEGYTGKAFTSVVWREGDVQYEVNLVYSTRGEPEQVVQDLAAAVAARL